MSADTTHRDSSTQDSELSSTTLFGPANVEEVASIMNAFTSRTGALEKSLVGISAAASAATTTTPQEPLTAASSLPQNPQEPSKRRLWTDLSSLRTRE